MKPTDPKDPNRPPEGEEQSEPDMNDVAGELMAEMTRSDERAAELPPALARRLIAIGESEVAKAALGAPTGLVGGVRAARGPMGSPSDRAGLRVSSWGARAGWLVALAATVAWLVLPSPLAEKSMLDGANATGALLDSLLETPELVRVPWAASTDPAATTATGEVVWDARTQRGVMRIAGLVPNDPRLAQYQLWIIDGDRDARYPVDGGVFDVTGSGEVLVPITARLRVGRPTLFAITLERPGGVVVSARERLVLAAPVEG